MIRFNNIRHCLFLGLFLFTAFIPRAQHIIRATGQGLDPELLKSGPVTSIKAAQVKFKGVQSKLLAQGYLAAGVDSISQQGDTITGHLYVGPRYEFATLRGGNIDDHILAQSGFREKYFSGKPVDFSRLLVLYDDILTAYENSGFPFARIRLLVDSLSETNITGRLRVDKMDFVVIDSIILKGDKVNEKYIASALGLSKGDPYNEEKIRAVPVRLKEIPFVQSIKPPEVVFTEKGAHIYVYLQKKKANRFNGILGVLPDNQTGKIVITGELDFGLINAFNGGEDLRFKWRKLQTETQELKMALAVPYTFGLPIGLAGKFDLYKRDSTYVEISPTAEVRFQMKGGQSIGVFFNQYQSRLLNLDPFLNATTLPAFNDTRKSTFGLTVLLNTLDYKLNPRKGFFCEAKAGAGLKNILQLDQLDAAIYENIALKSSQYEVEGVIGYFFPLFKRMTFLLQANGSTMINDNLFVNEMKRLGGISTIRGFDDQSILASTFLIGTAEYRFQLEQNSYLYAFLDYGYYENNSSDGFEYDNPMGFGGGISFQTKPGIFTINYALGKLNNTNFLLRAAKIHFGFVNYF